MAKRELSFADQIDGATSVDDLKNRLRSILQQLESHFESRVALYYVDDKTNNDPNKYKTGDIIVDSSVIPGALVLYTFDAKKKKLTQTLQSFTGNLPFSQNEVFIGTGAATIFNTQMVFVPQTTQVYKAGSRQRIGTDYTEVADNNKQIQFTVAPANGAVIVVDYEIARIL